MITFELSTSEKKCRKLFFNFKGDLLSSLFSKNNCTVYLDESGPKMFLLFSHIIDEKFVSFLIYLKRWLKVVLVFGKEHANWSNISGVTIG